MPNTLEVARTNNWNKNKIASETEEEHQCDRVSSNLCSHGSLFYLLIVRPSIHPHVPACLILCKCVAKCKIPWHPLPLNLFAVAHHSYRWHSCGSHSHLGNNTTRLVVSPTSAHLGVMYIFYVTKFTGRCFMGYWNNKSMLVSVCAGMAQFSTGYIRWKNRFEIIQANRNHL